MWGGIVGAVPVGSLNPWMILGQTHILLFIIFMVDTIVRTRRLGPATSHARVLRICGSIVLFTILSNITHAAVVAGLVNAPDMIVVNFLCVVLIMSYELGQDVLRSAQLAQSLKATESKLHESELRMDVAIRAADIGLWSWDIVQGKFWFTDLGLRILGFPPGVAFDRKEFGERVHPDDRDDLEQALLEAARNDGDYRGEYRIRMPGGGVRYILARGQVEFERNGVPAQLHGVIADITERKQQEERFRLAVEASPNVMLMVDADGNVALANRQAEVVFQYSRDELVGLSVDRLVPDRFRARHAEARAGYLRTAEARLMAPGRDLCGRRKDGSEVPVEIALNPIRIGDQPFVLASIADISERKRMERESVMQRDELAHLSRVALLAELSGSLAHELNQPLTAILSNAQAATRFMAMDPPDLDEVRESLVNIVESDKRAGEVIRRLRAMLRKEASDYRALDLNEVVFDVLRIIRSDLLNRNTETVLDLATDLPPIHGDRIQLQQVLLNLVMNGCDAMADVSSGRALTLRTRALADGGVEVQVSDLGRGIPPEDLERIFAPFVSSKSDGMGLGLAVCTTIIESHRGKLWASNNPERGASLHFRLPPFDGRETERSEDARSG
jgi:PAS domain S-box-containing protein